MSERGHRWRGARDATGELVGDALVDVVLQAVGRALLLPLRVLAGLLDSLF